MHTILGFSTLKPQQGWQVCREGSWGQSDQESQFARNSPGFSTESSTSRGSSQSWANPVSRPPWPGDTQQGQVRAPRQICITLAEELEQGDVGLTVRRNALGASRYNVCIQGASFGTLSLEGGRKPQWPVSLPGPV